MTGLLGEMLNTTNDFVFQKIYDVENKTKVLNN